MLQTEHDGQIITLSEDLSVSEDEYGSKIEYRLSADQTKCLQHAAWVDGRTIHQQARIFCLQAMGLYDPWQPDPKMSTRKPPALKAPPMTKRKR